MRKLIMMAVASFVWRKIQSRMSNRQVTRSGPYR